MWLRSFCSGGRNYGHNLTKRLSPTQNAVAPTICPTLPLDVEHIPKLLGIRFSSEPRVYARENVRENETKLKDYKTSRLERSFFHALIHSDPTTTAWSNPGLIFSNTSAASSNGARETFHLCW